MSSLHTGAPPPTAYLILDWNGTVVDDLNRAYAATRAALSTVPTPTGDGPLASIADFQARFRLPLARFFTDQGVPPDRVEQVIDTWNREMATHPTVLAPGARTLLSRARELDTAIYVVSGADTDTVRADAASLAVEPFITAISGSAHPKRDVVAALRRTNRPLVFVGDTEYDISEGAAAGAITVGTSYGYRPSDALLRAGAHLIVDDLSSLAPLLEALTRQPHDLTANGRRAP